MFYLRLVLFSPDFILQLIAFKAAYSQSILMTTRIQLRLSITTNAVMTNAITTIEVNSQIKRRAAVILFLLFKTLTRLEEKSATPIKCAGF